MLPKLATKLLAEGFEMIGHSKNGIRVFRKPIKNGTSIISIKNEKPFKEIERIGTETKVFTTGKPKLSLNNYTEGDTKYFTSQYYIDRKPTFFDKTKVLASDRTIATKNGKIKGITLYEQRVHSNGLNTTQWHKLDLAEQTYHSIKNGPSVERTIIENGSGYTFQKLPDTTGMDLNALLAATRRGEIPKPKILKGNKLDFQEITKNINKTFLENWHT